MRIARIVFANVRHDAAAIGVDAIGLDAIGLDNAAMHREIASPPGSYTKY